MNIRTLSIRITEELHCRLQEEIGKGKINNFIEEVVRERLDREEANLITEYKEAWINGKNLRSENSLA